MRRIASLALPFLAVLALGTLPAWAGEPTAKGGAGQLRIPGEAEAYVRLTSSTPLTLTFHGAGELTVRLRSVLPADQPPSEGPQVTLRLPNGQQEKATLSVFPAKGKSFTGHADRLPGGAGKDRVLTLEEASGVLSASVQRGEAALAIHWKGKVSKHREVAVGAAARRRASAANAAAASAAAAANAEPSAAAGAVGSASASGSGSATAVAPLVSDETAQTAPAPSAPAPEASPTARGNGQLLPLDTSPAPREDLAVRSGSDSGPRRLVLPLALLGGAALCAVGSALSVGLAVGENNGYNGTPELQNGAPTNRAGMLTTANREAAAAEVLGAAALALLVASGLTLAF